MYNWSPTSENIDRTNVVRMRTSRSRMTDWMSESTIVLRPGTIATVLSALNTLKVRNTDRFPKFFMNSVAYLLKK
jgi:hypothetical protein